MTEPLDLEYFKRQAQWGSVRPAEVVALVAEVVALVAELEHLRAENAELRAVNLDAVALIDLLRQGTVVAFNATEAGTQLDGPREGDQYRIVYRDERGIPSVERILPPEDDQ